MELRLTKASCGTPLFVPDNFSGEDSSAGFGGAEEATLGGTCVGCEVEDALAMGPSALFPPLG